MTDATLFELVSSSTGSDWSRSEMTVLEATYLHTSESQQAVVFMYVNLLFSNFGNFLVTSHHKGDEAQSSTVTAEPSKI